MNFFKNPFAKSSPSELIAKKRATLIRDAPAVKLIDLSCVDEKTAAEIKDFLAQDFTTLPDDRIEYYFDWKKEHNRTIIKNYDVKPVTVPEKELIELRSLRARLDKHEAILKNVVVLFEEIFNDPVAAKIYKKDNKFSQMGDYLNKLRNEKNSKH